MMNDKITNSLKRLFFEKGKRIVFWYDYDQNLREDYEALQIEGVEKIEIKKNAFGIKYHILREAPNQKFLLYHEGERPENANNWLLDVLLAHAEFRTDQTSILLSELELGIEYTEIVQTHSEFFKSKTRIADLKSCVTQQDSLKTVRLKMLSVLANTPTPQLDLVLEKLLDELANDKDDKINLIERCNLGDFLWARVDENYGYDSTMPGIKDFAITLFKFCYYKQFHDDDTLYSQASVFLGRWKDNRQYKEAFTELSNRYAALLNIEQDLQERDIQSIVSLDYFELIDHRIISDLVRSVRGQTITAPQVEEIIRMRRSGFWYTGFESIYNAIDYGIQFMMSLKGLDLTMTSALEGVQHYIKHWFKVDQLYRKYTYYARISQQATLLDALSEQIEDFYTNQYLLKVNNYWQAQVDAMATWEIPTIQRQQEFYADYVTLNPFRNRKRKLFVVISDALRYEVAEELMGLIRSQNRYDATLNAMLAVLPTYTQLGMAALLPHQHLLMNPDKGKDVVYIDDGRDTRGTDNRNKILAGVGGIAIQADDVIQMKREDAREHFKPYDLVYVYHNHIDQVGDDRQSEAQTFQAVEDALVDLVKLIKKLNSANAYNIIVTADHGFLFQNRELADSDYIEDDPTGDQIIATDRRFVFGQGLRDHPSFKKFTASQLGLQGSFDVQIPKSINRLRQKGSGSRYVHGGASLQEVVIPVLSVNVKRSNDIRKVDVNIIQGVSSTISTGQVAITLYQTEPVTDKVQERKLSIGLYTNDGQLISENREQTFDFTDVNDRNREVTVRLLLSRAADAVNNQLVYIRLMEKESGTSHEVIYASAEYTLRRSFMSDFD